MAGGSDPINGIIRKLTITRGASKQIGKAQWEKREYSVVMDIPDMDRVNVAKNNGERLLKRWLEQWDSENEPYANVDVEKIRWHTSKGRKGPFERSVDRHNPEFQKLLTDLKAKGRSFVRCGLYYWIFQDDKTIGRKPAEEVALA